MIKHIVFDVDRTLVDSYQSELISLNNAIEIVKGYKLSSEDLHRLTTLPTSVFFKSLNLTDDDLVNINKEWEKQIINYPTLCFNGIKDVIRKLYNDGYSISILTSRNKNEVLELNDILKDIISLFSIIVTSDLVDNPKPSIDSMSYLCNKLNCTMDEIIYVGDSIIDKTFAENCNCIFIPACWENKELIGEPNFCTNPIDVIKIINKYKD